MYIVNVILNNTDLLLNIFYISTIFCGISILIHKNAIISIIYFMLVYVNSSLYLYYIGYNGMPLLLILIYVGAIAILFLFILTLINVKEQEDQYRYSAYALRNNNNVIIFINLLIILMLYIYDYSKDLVIGSQIYNILDKIIFNISGNNIGSASANYSASQAEMLLDITADGLINGGINHNIYLNVPASALDYPINSLSEVVIIGQSMYTTYSILLLLLGLILVLSIIAAIAILYTTHKCLITKTI